jgi:hypothetical protein
LEKIVRVGNIGATLVLRCSSGLESEADLKSVKISELAQKLPELATYFSSNLMEIPEIQPVISRAEKNSSRNAQ